MKFFRLVVAVVGIWLLAGTSSGSNLIAAQDGSKIISTREKAMADVKDRLKDINAMLKGKKVYSATRVEQHALAIQEHAFRMPELFPKNSYRGKTRALPAIWVEWRNFKAMARELDDYATELQFVARNDKRLVKEAFVKVAKTCVSCHDKYKKER